MKRHSGFTLIELIAVLIVLAILSAFALPRYFDHGAAAAEAADEGALNGIRTALNLAHIKHRHNGAPVADWVDEVTDIAPLLEHAQLPTGIVISGVKLEDQRGNTYILTAETATEPALLTLDTSGPGGGGGS